MRGLATMVAAVLLAGQAGATCIDVNADDLKQLTRIVHVTHARARAIEVGRPWPSVASLTAIRGIGRGRIEDILNQQLACAGLRAAPGVRERVEGAAIVLDADTLNVAGSRVRLIGLDAPEEQQICWSEGRRWPCGEVATAAVAELVGSLGLSCEIYGHDRWRRVLGVCYQDGRDINETIVREGWALAWYPENGAVLGPRYDEAQQEAETKALGLWRGTFENPWLWRQRGNAK